MKKKICDVRAGDIIIDKNNIMVVRSIEGYFHGHFFLNVTIMQTEYDENVPEILETRRATWDCGGRRVNVETLEI